MAAPADYWDSVDMKALAAGGFVNEDVMQQIHDISKIPLPFTDAVGTDTADNSYTEWTEDGLGAVNLDNAVVSGSDATGNDAKGGSRMGNHCQNSIKVLAVTERARSVNAIGTSDEFARQVMMRQNECRQDVEAIAISNQASVADDNDTIAGKAGGFSAWLKTNDLVGAGGASGGFNTGTKLVVAPTPGTGRALSFAYIRDMIEAAYVANGTPTMLMSVPKLIKGLSTFMFSDTGKGYAAVPTANVGGEAPTAQVQQSFINVMRTDFGFTIRIVPNRIQQTYDDATTVTPLQVVDVFLIDPSQVALAYLKNYVTKPLAKLGLSDRSQVSVDWTVKVYIEKAHAVIRDILPASTVVV